jgi:uncharacterized protein (DUF2252 family)
MEAAQEAARSDEVLTASNEGRMPELVPIRFGRMLQSPFTFYRGSAAIMAADLASTPNSGLRVQACGDAHLLNFGGFATPERQVVFDVNDLDETLPAPWEWDLKRLTASIVIAAQYLAPAGKRGRRAATATVRAYRERMARLFVDARARRLVRHIPLDRAIAEMTPAPGSGSSPPSGSRKRTSKAPSKTSFLKLAEHHGALPKIKDNPPLIFHPSEEQAPGIRTQYREALAMLPRVTGRARARALRPFQLCDLAVKVVGVGSVGTQCLVALFMAADNDPLFLQIKEARASVLEPYAGASLHANHGQRVVAGQRLMQGASDMFLGWTTGKNGRHYYFRQVTRCQDQRDRRGMGRRPPDHLRPAVRLGAGTSACALGDAALIAGYMGSKCRLRRRHLRVRRRVQRPESARLPGFRQGDSRRTPRSAGGGQSMSLSARLKKCVLRVALVGAPPASGWRASFRRRSGSPRIRPSGWRTTRSPA